MSSILALDVGFKRIGVAVSESKVLSRPVKIIFRKSNAQVFSEIEQLIEKYKVDKIVIGLPLAVADGSETKMSEKIRKFAEKLKDYLKGRGKELEVIFWEETFTSQMAKEELESLKKKRRYVDDVAAAKLLDFYLNASQPENRG